MGELHQDLVFRHEVFIWFRAGVRALDVWDGGSATSSGANFRDWDRRSRRPSLAIVHSRGHCVADPNCGANDERLQIWNFRCLCFDRATGLGLAVHDVAGFEHQNPNAQRGDLERSIDL